jgi:DNA-directed RNA polymerase subunit RPC12/RpoP
MSEWSCGACGKKFENMMSGDTSKIMNCPFCKSGHIVPW